MTNLHLKYVHAYRDRHGHPRYYFRKRGCRKVTLPGLPGSAEFMAAYQRALNEVEEPTARPRIGLDLPGSVSHTIAGFYGSAAFTGLRPSSQRIYRGVLERFRREHGDKSIAAMDTAIVRKVIAEAGTPGAANYLRRVLRLLLKFAVAQGIRQDNPVRDVDPIRVESRGFHAWTEDQIAQFEAYHPVGSKARLAMALQLFTGQRRSDVIRMTWRDIANGRISITQLKTGARLKVPVLPELRRILDATTKTDISILVTAKGRPFQSDTYGAWFKKEARKAGLSRECTSHGLRKAAARRLAEAGCTPHQIASITGHVSLREVERYTKSVDQERLADEAMRLATSGQKALSYNDGNAVG